MTTTRPAVDPELQTFLATLPDMPPLGEQTLEMIRPYATVPVETALSGHDHRRQEMTIASVDGADIPLTILRPIDHDPTAGTAPCVYWIHGGGMVMGDRYCQIDIPAEWLAEFGAVVVSVDHRLAPDVTGMTLVEDCYAGLVWITENTHELGIDPTQLIIAGTSAGGGLAAGTTLLARDRKGPAIAAQILISPMLDHRNNTVSSVQFEEDAPIWSRGENAFGWRSVLGGTGDTVPIYVSPATADDLSGLPTTYIDGGTAEVFRDEIVTYASRIWAAGGQAELHIWAGGFHGFDALCPRAATSQSARRTRTAWLARAIGHITQTAQVPTS